MLRFVVGAVTVLALGACASSASQQAQTPEPAKRSWELPDSEDAGRQSADASSYGCDSSSSDSFGLYSEGRKKLNGHEIYLSHGPQTSKVSLCDLLRRTGKKAAFFQFAGVTCEECKEKSLYYKSVIDSNQYRDIAWFVVITDKFDDGYGESDYQYYMDTYAPNAIRVHDEAKLWKALSADPTVPTRATTFAMNKDMDFYVINREGTPKYKVLEAAVGLAQEIRD